MNGLGHYATPLTIESINTVLQYINLAGTSYIFMRIWFYLCILFHPDLKMLTMHMSLQAKFPYISDRM